MGGEIYYATLPSNTGGAAYKFRKLAEEEGYIITSTIMSDRFDLGMETLDDHDKIEIKGEEHVLFENDDEAYEFIYKYHNLGSGFYIVYVKDEDDPKGWHYFGMDQCYLYGDF